ncbi:unnamed protein product, partial [Meganyctiphanes norvegica]
GSQSQVGQPHRLFVRMQSLHKCVVVGWLLCGIVGALPQVHFPGPDNDANSKTGSGTVDALVRIVPGNTDQGVVTGVLDITNYPSGGLLIRGSVTGLTPGLHGFHIHTEGQLTNQCRDAAGHFNPFMNTHGSPNDAIRHVGDLGNVYANAKGVAHLHIVDSHGSFDPNSQAYIGGRSIVIHAGQDDLGRGGDEGSLSTGNAGGRVACGIIEIQQNIPPQPTTAQPHQPYQTPHSHHNQPYQAPPSHQDQPYQAPHSYQNQAYQTTPSYQNQPYGAPNYQNKPNGTPNYQNKPYGAPSYQNKPQPTYQNQHYGAPSSFQNQPPPIGSSLLGQIYQPHGSPPNQQQQLHGSPPTQQQQPHGSQPTQQQQPHGSPPTQQQPPHGSPPTQQQQPHGSSPTQQHQPQSGSPDPNSILSLARGT